MSDEKIEELRDAYVAAEAAYTTARTDHADAYRAAQRAAARRLASACASACLAAAYRAAAYRATAADDAWIAYQAAMKAKGGKP